MVWCLTFIAIWLSGMDIHMFGWCSTVNCFALFLCISFLLLLGLMFNHPSFIVWWYGVWLSLLLLLSGMDIHAFVQFYTVNIEDLLSSFSGLFSWTSFLFLLGVRCQLLNGLFYQKGLHLSIMVSLSFFLAQTPRTTGG
jgi:hypothetical protein